MEAACLDSDVIIDMIRGSKPLSLFLDITHAGVCTTSVTVAELYYGVFKSGTLKDFEVIDKLVEDIVIIEFAADDAKLAGKMMAAIDKKGRKLDFRDIAIAAICINRRLRLLTRNIRHFARLKEFGLELG
ncbi:MAG: type II toxin-antitoxin system VapC family toxin [Candidatus Micrarchaeaceae archaeon]|jgi:predicted nucleic acid-binding protein